MTERLMYLLMYLFGYTPWDTGVTPPELVSAVEGPDALPPGRALDLGCGTGTNAIYLARHGWDATGVDLQARPLRAARRKAAAAGVPVRFLRGDVSRLPELGVGGGYRLLFDLGCFHTVPENRRDGYAAGASAVATEDATLLLYGFAPASMPGAGAGVTGDELRQRFTGWDLREATMGTGQREAWWFRLERARLIS